MQICSKHSLPDHKSLTIGSLLAIQSNTLHSSRRSVLALEVQLINSFHRRPLHRRTSHFDESPRPAYDQSHQLATQKRPSCVSISRIVQLVLSASKIIHHLRPTARNRVERLRSTTSRGKRTYDIESATTNDCLITAPKSSQIQHSYRLSHVAEQHRQYN